MTREEIIAYAERDWALLRDTKERYWAERKRDLNPEVALAIADGLRRHVNSLRPEWPSAEDRERDLEVHARVSEALRTVHLAPSSTDEQAESQCTRRARQPRVEEDDDEVAG